MSMVHLNGRLVAAVEARIAPDDRGFTLGDALFETMRVAGGRVFRLGNHLDRLAAAARRVGIPLPAGVEIAVDRVIAANGVADGAVRLTLTRGSGAPGIRSPAAPSPTLLVIAYPLARGAADGEPGVRAIVASGRLNERGATAGLKQTGYMEGILARREAELRGADEAILLNTRGDLAEATAANLFLVREGELFTPDLASGVLPGITRGAVLEIAASLGLRAREQRLPGAALARADEAFLTSSLRGVVPLLAVDGVPLGEGVPGEITRRIAREYHRVVERETADAGGPAG